MSDHLSDDPLTFLGFDPRILAHRTLSRALDAIGDAKDDATRARALESAHALIDDMSDADLILDWRRFDEDDESTHPDMVHGEPVLAMRIWTNPHRQYGPMSDRSKCREAHLYEPVYGHYMRKRELDGCPPDADDADCFVFAFEHGEQRYESAYDDYCDPPLWWTPIATPQRLDLDVLPKATEKP